MILSKKSKPDILNKFSSPNKKYHNEYEDSPVKANKMPSK